MNAALIGLAAGIITIFITVFLKQFGKNIFYGLFLTAIAVLYIGYTWTETTTVIISFIQAILFVFFAYMGIKKNLYYLVAGYFLHGLWDIVYSHTLNPSLLPPHYDWFCLTYDFVVGFYLWGLKYKERKPELLPKAA